MIAIAKWKNPHPTADDLCPTCCRLLTSILHECEEEMDQEEMAQEEPRSASWLWFTSAMAVLVSGTIFALVSDACMASGWGWLWLCLAMVMFFSTGLLVGRATWGE